MWAISAKVPGHFHAHRTAAHEHECKLLLDLVSWRVFERGHLLGSLECQQHFAADCIGVFERFQASGKLLPIIVAEIVVLNAGGDDQEIVGQFIFFEPNPALLRIDAGNFFHQHFNIALPAQDRAQWPRNFVARQKSRGHLVEHRAEKMVVSLVEQRHAERGSIQGARRVEAAEASADYNHARSQAGSTSCGVIVVAGKEARHEEAIVHGMSCRKTCSIGK
jgi:hypothetical protein